MAATLTDSGELTYLSFNIDKVESTPDGDLYVYGKATDGSIDHDQQIVDPSFSAKAIADWLTTGGNLRVQHNPQRDPAGVGIEVHSDDTGATWVKGLVVEPIAKKLVSKGVLRAYSVGIANPTIERDITGKARGGIIKNGKIVEISLVDRPANASCGIQLVKTAGNGIAEYTGSLFGDAAEIQKALSGSVSKTGPAVAEAINNIDQFETPVDITIDFTPNDLMKILQDKMVAQASKRDFDPDVGGGVDRDKLKDSDFAGRHRSFPIVTQADVSDALHSIGRAGSDNYSADELRSRIISIAHRKGFSVPGEDSKKAATGEYDPFQYKTVDPDHDGDNDATPSGDTDHDYWTAGGKQKKPLPGKPEKKEAVPDVIKDPDGSAKPKKGKKGKKLPPWLNKPADSSKCHSDPKTASGAEEPADMQPAPVGELVETPAPAHMKQQALIRYKTLGMDADFGILHDLTCPAYHPGQVTEVHPGSTFANSINVEVWQRKALAAATGKSIAEAMESQQVWQAAVTLKTADQNELDVYRFELHKAFRDANPGPSSFPSPTSISPKKFNRPLITDGHSATSTGHSGPNSSANVASGTPNAHHFDKPPLSSGHQSPSPSFMKSSFEYPEQQGVPQAISYDMVEKEKARRALSMMHDHLNHMFPGACPMLDQDPYRQETVTQVPQVAGLGKSEPEEVLSDVYKYIRKLEKKVRAGEITEVQAKDKLAKRTAEKYARDLAKQVEKGLTSKDAVLKALGIEIPKSRPEHVKNVTYMELPPATKAAGGSGTAGWNETPPVNAGLTPDVMKTMMSEILQPFEAKLDAQTQHIETQNSLLNEYQEKFAAQEKELAEHRSRWDALANQPDPSTAAFTGLALNPARRAPEGVTKRADVNERVQGMMMRQLETAWRTSENPAEREAAYAALMKYKGNVG